MAAFVMLGAKLGKIFGARLVFQVMALAHGVSMAIMALSPSAAVMNLAQALAGLAAAVILISVGFNNLIDWGVILASPAAPIAPLGLSPAPFMILAGIVKNSMKRSWKQR